MLEIADLLVSPCMMLTARNVRVGGDITAKFPATRHQHSHIVEEISAVMAQSMRCRFVALVVV